ncbi:MAG TPA: SHOCT domain-containing protein [Mycobacterium sp.]|nr:SHOCT domain-containing protein [Mycobacterium sp.]HUH70645.1 SHOCT domain-containing protein [Mycobacterium sp.]
MLARYLKAQLVVLLCGGLVGPIFLVVYFTLGLGSLVQWMFYVGLLITVADVLIALALANYAAKSSAKNAALEQSGVPAQFTLAEDNKPYDLSGQAGPLMEILQILKANNVPLNRMVDIRSNPVLRQEIEAVVRRAAEQQAPAARAASVATSPKPPIAQRLRELETLYASGALTDQEYNSRRAQIISEI